MSSYRHGSFMAPKGLGKILITPITDKARFAFAQGRDWKREAKEAIQKEIDPIRPALTDDEVTKLQGRLWHACMRMLEKDQELFERAE